MIGWTQVIVPKLCKCHHIHRRGLADVITMTVLDRKSASGYSGKLWNCRCGREREATIVAENKERLFWDCVLESANISLTPTKVIWEAGASIRKMPQSYEQCNGGVRRITPFLPREVFHHSNGNPNRDRSRYHKCGMSVADLNMLLEGLWKDFGIWG